MAAAANAGGPAAAYAAGVPASAVDAFVRELSGRCNDRLPAVQFLLQHGVRIAADDRALPSHRLPGIRHFAADISGMMCMSTRRPAPAAVCASLARRYRARCPKCRGPRCWMLWRRPLVMEQRRPQSCRQGHQHSQQLPLRMCASALILSIDVSSTIGEYRPCLHTCTLANVTLRDSIRQVPRQVPRFSWTMLLRCRTGSGRASSSHAWRSSSCPQQRYGRERHLSDRAS